MPGFYHVEAAALGGEATDVQFELVAPTAGVVTKTAAGARRERGKAGRQRAKKNRRQRAR